MTTLAKTTAGNIQLSKKQKQAATFALMFISVGAIAAAPTAGDFLYGIYAEVIGWLTGAPGIIISLFTFGVAAFQGIMKQNYINAGGAFIIAMMFANAQDAIEYFLTAGLPVASGLPI